MVKPLNEKDYLKYKNSNGVKIVTPPIGLYVYLSIFFIGFSVFLIGTIRRILFSRWFFIANKKDKTGHYV